MSDLARRDFARILLIKPSSMGDVVHALPVLHGLRIRYPTARISWLLSTACIDLLTGHDELDEIIPFDRKRYGRIGRSLSASADFARFLYALRGRRFDLVIDLQGLFRSGFMAWACRATTRIGPGNARELAGVFYTDRIEIPTLEEHAVDRYYRVSRLLGFADVPVTFNLSAQPEARAEMRDRLGQRDADPDNYVALFSSARWETKVWPADHFAALADQLHDEHGVDIVLMGAPSDAALGEAIAAGTRCKPALVFDAMLSQMVAGIDSARLIVGNESGPIHVAVALNRPTVTLVGPTSPVRTGPYGQPDSVVRLPLDCAPCYLKRLAQCEHDHACLRDLTPERVARACAPALARVQRVAVRDR